MNYKDRIEQYIFVIRELVSREIKRKYARSVLGIVWSVLNPLLTMAVMSMIFSFMFKRSIENFPIYYLTGSVFWSMFTTSTNGALTALVDNKNMLMKVKLPMLVFPLSRSCTALANFGYSMVAYILMLLVFRVRPNVYMPLILFYAAGMFLFATGMGYILSVLYVFFGDIKHLYGVLLHVWFYLNAIFYPIDTVSPMLRNVIEVNPTYNFIVCARKCIMQGELPTPEQWARLFIWSVGGYVVGRLFFNRMKTRVLAKM